MPKILSQAGISMAPGYSIEGGIIGVEELDTHDVILAENFGDRVFSERLRSLTAELTATDVLQSAAFSATLPGTGLGFPDGPSRILGVTVLHDGDAADVLRVQVSMADQSTGLEFPVYAWDDTVGAEITGLWDIGSGAINVFFLPALVDNTPNLMTRTGNAALMPNLIMRGSTTAFGAGNVTIVGLVHVALANAPTPVPGDPSSHGLPLPGW